MSDPGTIRELLEDRPDLEEPLEAVLAVDERAETWTFDDLPIDSGPFGELVSRGIVESVGDEYRLSDRDATRAALRGTATAETGDREETSAGLIEAVSLPTGAAVSALDRTTTALIAAAVGFVVLVRVHAVGTVYRNGDIVLSGNDAYYYRYWIEQVAANSGGAVDFGALSELPSAVQNGEPLMVATLWWLAEFLGGSVAAIGHVLAWYPVVSAAITAGIVYLLAVTVTGDRRIGLASLVLFAIIPGHAMRTAIGFADHHAFDYPWLAGTAFALVLLANTSRPDLGRLRTWLVSGGLGVCVAAQVLAWEAGPLLIAPVGVAVLARSLIAIRADRSPTVGASPILVGLGLAASLAGAVHLFVGWHTAEVAFAPAVVLAGSILVTLVAEGIHRTTGEVLHALGVDVAGGLAGLVALIVLFPASWASLMGRMDTLVGTQGIAETVGLFDLTSSGFLLLFGFALVVALPAMLWSLRAAVDDGRWAVLTTYGWYFLVLAAFQVRFVGELAAFVAVFAGIGFVWIAAWIDLVPWPDLRDRGLEVLRIPDRGTLTTLALLFLLIGSLGIVQVPVKTSQVTIEGDAYASASFIGHRSAELGQTHPENRVFSEWGRTRMHNYFVSGESRSFGYAQDNYGAFAASPDPDSWYPRFDGRIGYVVLATEREGPESGTALWQLTEQFGSATERFDGVAHFQALYRAPGGSRTVFAVVPGAQVTGTAPANSTVTLSTDVTIPTETTFEYTRRVTANETGQYAVRVANPGSYTIGGPSGNITVTVDPEDVRSGATVAGS